MKRFLLILAVILAASSVEATTFYVGKSGSDANSCATAQSSTAGNRKLTFASGIGCLSAGDTLIIGDGTYAERIANTVPGGSSWSAVTTVRAENNRLAILRPTGNGRTISHDNTGQNYIVWDGVVVDCDNDAAGNCFVVQTNAHHIRLINSEVKNSFGQGVGMFVGGTNVGGNEIINNWIHDNGTSDQLDHGIYSSTPNNLIEHNTVETSTSVGIHLYDGGAVTALATNIVRYNVVRDNGGRGILVGGAGHQIYNNLIYNNGTDPDPFRFGIHLEYTNGCDACLVYNNVIYGHPDRAIDIDSQGSVSTAAVIKNNIIHSNTSQIVNAGSGTVFGGNLCGSAGTGCEDVQATVGNIFVNAAAGDFTLVESSSAIDSGVVISGFSSGRYVGSAPDAGAFEAPIRSGASVEDGDETRYRTSFSMPAQSVRDGVGLKGCTTANWTVVVAGAGATETGCTITQTNRVDVTISAVTQGQSLTDAYTRGALTDNICIGGSIGGCLDAKVRTYSALTGANNVIDEPPPGGDPGTTSFGGKLTIGGAAAVQ